MINYWIKSNNIKNNVFIPKYYDPTIVEEIRKLSNTHKCYIVSDLIQDGVVECTTGDEIGKSCYGTGDIPFVRTSDISNWEINSVPKQGVNREIYEQYADTQDVKPGDILLVRDGTYLIGHNCIIDKADKEILFQSHILKLRVLKEDIISPELLFLSINSPIVQRQIRSVQFTADIIDTIGNRYNEITIPIPLNEAVLNSYLSNVRESLNIRTKGKAFIKQCPIIIEQVLLTGSGQPIKDFSALSIDELVKILTTDTLSAEFGEFEHSWICSDDIINNIFLPKYYDPLITEELNDLEKHCSLKTIRELKEEGHINYYTGDEIGKMAYGTGDFPFIRTSDFSNWEIKYNPKQAVSEEIFEQYREKQDVKKDDIFLVRDGTYLVGRSCLVTECDSKSLFCGGLYKVSVNSSSLINPYLLLGLLNSYIVKRQIRAKQFTRDVIDTIGHRLEEVVIPIPKSTAVKRVVSDAIEDVVTSRIEARQKISSLANSIN